MVILMNFSTNPFKVQYTDGSKAFVKTIPINGFVAMKGLRVSEQISNRSFLAKKDITIYDYERGTYYHRSPETPTGATMPFIFVGNNIKPSQNTTITTVDMGVAFGSASGLTSGYTRLQRLV
jgi:hypothetical protein